MREVILKNEKIELFYIVENATDKTKLQMKQLLKSLDLNYNLFYIYLIAVKSPPNIVFALKINANMPIGRLMYYLIFSKNKNKAKLAVKCQCRNNQNVVEFSHFCNISISQGITYAAIQFFLARNCIIHLFSPFSLWSNKIVTTYDILRFIKYNMFGFTHD